MRKIIFAAALLATPGLAAAQTFDFEGAATGTYTSLSQTSGGVTATVSRVGGKSFGISNISAFTPVFGSRTLDAFVDTSNGAFVIDFSTGLSDFTIEMGDFFADDDTLTLSLYSGLGGTGTLLGSTSASYPGTNGFPVVGTLALTSATPYLSAVFQGGSAAFPNSVFYDNITVAPAGAVVPEPASWALMIGGFGMAGGALRRRRTSVAFA